MALDGGAGGAPSSSSAAHLMPRWRPLALPSPSCPFPFRAWDGRREVLSVRMDEVLPLEQTDKSVRETPVVRIF